MFLFSTHRVLMIVPISSEQKSPCAIAPSASIPYRFAEKTIFFRLQNSPIRLIFPSSMT